MNKCSLYQIVNELWGLDRGMRWCKRENPQGWRPGGGNESDRFEGALRKLN